MSGRSPIRLSSRRLRTDARGNGFEALEKKKVGPAGKDNMIGDIIAELRKDMYLKQKDLAQYLSVSVATISHYESGVNQPDMGTVIRLADFFGVSVDYMLGRTRMKIDWKEITREVSLSNGKKTSIDQIMSDFMSLSDQSQCEMLSLLALFKMRDKLQHERYMRASKDKG